MERSMLEKPWDVGQIPYDTDGALLDALRRHDRQACTGLLQRYVPALHRLAYHLTGNRDDADDVLQESFIQACRQVDQFEGRSSLGSWLYRIVLNTGLMRLRRHTPVLVSLDAPARPDGTCLLPLLPDPSADPGDQVVSQEIGQEIQVAIQALPEALRVAVVLRDLEGLDTHEAAALLAISDSALKVRLHRGHAALRQSLAPYLAEPRAGSYRN